MTSRSELLRVRLMGRMGNLWMGNLQPLHPLLVPLLLPLLLLLLPLLRVRLMGRMGKRSILCAEGKAQVTALMAG